MNARTPLALLYNDQSVLEQHHAATAYRILSDPKTNILCNVSASDYSVCSSDCIARFALLPSVLVSLICMCDVMCDLM